MTAAGLAVLVVDDNAECLASCRHWLEHQPEVGLVACVRSGEDALLWTDRVRPDVVLMEIGMPGLGGLETTRILKAQPRAPHVVLMSFWDSSVERGEAARVGADGFVCKPDITRELQPVLQRLVAARATVPGAPARPHRPNA